MMKKWISVAVSIALLLTACPVGALTSSEKNVHNITLTNERKQTVKGLGVFTAFTGDFDMSKAAAAKAIYNDLGVSTFRLELPGQAGNADGSLNMEAFNEFLDIIQYGYDYGIEKYSVHIWSPPPHLKTNNDISGRNSDDTPATLLPEKEQEFCDWIVKCFDYITKVRKLSAPLAFSFQNEPENAFPYQSCFYGKEQYIRVSKLMRKTLDKAGYQDVILIGPEGGSYRANYTWLGEDFSAFDEDPEYRDAIGALCTHSYYLPGIAQNTDITKFRKNAERFPDKDIWQTEFSNAGLLPNDKPVDRVIDAMRVFASDMEWGGINYWSWWLGYNSYRPIDLYTQETLLEGDGVSTVRKSMHYNVLQKIYNSVHPGSKVRGVETDDENLTNSSGLFNDLAAFSDGINDTLLIINTSKSERFYNINNLSGISADVYSVTDSADYSAKLTSSINILNKKAVGVKIPPKSVNVLITSKKDSAPPKITLGDNPQLSLQDGIYISRDEKITLTANVDENAQVKIQDQICSLNKDRSFSKEIALTNKPVKYRIDALDENGNYAYPLFVSLKYDPTFVNIQLEDCPATVNNRYYELKGQLNVDADVYINDEKYESSGKNFSKNYPLDEGENKITIYAVDKNGNRSKDVSINVICDTTKPSLTLQKTPDTVNDAEIILKGNYNEPLRSFIVNGKSVAVGTDNDFVYKVLLNEGQNNIELLGEDLAGNVEEQNIQVNYQKTEKSARITDAVTYSPKLKGGILIDGILGENDWKIDNKAIKPVFGPAPNNIVNFGTLWDESNLYVAFDIVDELLVFNEDEVYKNDCIEVFVNGDGKKSGEYNNTDKQLFIGFNKNKGILYNNQNDVKTAWHETENGYQAEMAIPWKLMGKKPGDGVSIGFDVLVDDNDKTGARESIIGWNGIADNWKTTGSFGTLTLTTGPTVVYKEKDLTAASPDEESQKEPEQSGITVFYNGTQLSLGCEPFLENGRVMIPVRALSEYFGSTVKWQEEGKVIIESKDSRLSLFVGKNKADIDGEISELDAPPVLKDDRVFVPLRFFAEHFGLNVKWNEEALRVDIAG